MSELTSQLLTLFFALLGLGIILSVLFGGADGPKKFLGCLVWPFKALGKLAFVLVLLAILAVVALQMMPGVWERIGGLISHPATSGGDPPSLPGPERGEGAMLTWPLSKEHQNIVQRFGVTWSQDADKRHTGIDIEAPAKTEVFAIADGTARLQGSLVKADRPATSTWGSYVVIAHDDDSWTSSYLHIDLDPELTRNHGVRQGQRVGWVHYDHLHFGIRRAPSGDLSIRGALPKTRLDSGDPEFPEHFVDPMVHRYEYDTPD